MTKGFGRDPALVASPSSPAVSTKGFDPAQGDKFSRTYDHEKRHAAMRDAAPELYEALANTLAVARLKWGNLDEDVNVIFKHADAALSKARGEQVSHSASFTRQARD